ncbi:hypothetical protein OE88DRAFT_1645450 [Heliocybe sulcata]|uniref:AB hydrolase-1 domain-containing protein n=1 Tax=Heliocybe sulcata TaxID=5364 RepID=A0A5C3N2P6_9AGAM|nr:hypothetical protein OE88DRAFT_1645450 [Heliocybe sulcata]
MPTAPVDSSGTQLYYEDSGVPPNSSAYTTVVAIHGAFFHCGSFRRLLACGPAHGLRCISVNCRGYPLSTPYSLEELGIMREGDVHAQGLFLQARGLEIASLLVWLYRAGVVCPLEVMADRKQSGGLALYGWSAGNKEVLAFLAHADALPEESCRILAIILRSVILYDIPRFALGYSTSLLGLSQPFFQANVPSSCWSWLSAYYTHSPFYGDTSNLSQRPDADKTPTWDRLTAAERDSIMVYSDTELRFCKFDPRVVFKANYVRALLDPAIAKNVFPDLQVTVVIGEKSIWEAPTIGYIVDRDLQRSRHRGIKTRHIEVVVQRGANHFDRLCLFTSVCLSRAEMPKFDGFEFASAECASKPGNYHLSDTGLINMLLILSLKLFFNLFLHFLEHESETSDIDGGKRESSATDDFLTKDNRTCAAPITATIGKITDSNSYSIHLSLSPTRTISD